ncbi:putative polysaccharide polymerase protein [Paenibacillus sp. FSL R7-269]|uniref:EpsG family protein n=1 Tax=Paenibacillus sp. FSL R7-269 TaxID=1226755 RepID=UPI0003E20346|nr:EpsG family protein [Paenibacillus sp. FSL R7-269]ETT45158.1 putative polysaccharide polymerase protein [Paenibacillus sp. FSL R7-269]
MTHIVFVVSLFFLLPNINKKLPFFYFTFAVLFLFLALRYNYGNDYLSYSLIHSALNSGISAWGENDILFKYSNILIYNFQWFIAVVSFFYILVIYQLIKKTILIENYWISVLILLINPYLFLVHLSGIRQTIAICFIIISVFFLIKKRIIYYLLFIIIASGFHQSAIILLPMCFFINDRKIKKKWMVIIVGFLLFIVFTPLLELIINQTYQIFPQYRHYVEEGNENSVRSTLISSFLFFFIIFNINKLEGKELIFGKLSLIATIISIAAFKISMITRFGMYFDIFMIITIPQILTKINVRANKQILFILIVLIYLLRYFSFFNNPLWHDAYSTYRTILEK